MSAMEGKKILCSLAVFSSLGILLIQQWYFSQLFNEGIDLQGYFSTISVNVSSITRTPSAQEDLVLKQTYKHKAMLTIQFKGRLGNQMFRYSALLGLAATNDMIPVLHIHTSLAYKYFNYSTPVFHGEIANLKEVREFRHGQRHRWRHGGKHANFDPSLENLKYQNVTLHGYFISWKYWWNIKDKIQREFQFKSYIIDEVRSFIDNLVKESAHVNPSRNYSVIGIHVRRGDFLKKKVQEFGIHVSDVAYFQKARAYYVSELNHHSSSFDHQLISVVASNDMQWCKAHIQGENVFYSDGRSAEFDLALLSQCDHMIMSCGTFGFWASFLAGGLVTYDSHCVRPGSRLERYMNPDEYYLPHWTPL